MMWQVAQTFFMDDAIKAKARLDGIITVVDGANATWLNASDA
jgi:G3E family GTPase